jgi:hypothetical protein
MLGGVYKGMESISNEAVNAIQKVASPGSSASKAAEPQPETRPDPAHSSDRSSVGPITYSPRPVEIPDDPPQDLAHSSESEAQLAAWMLSHSSAPTASGVLVLVPTSDCLMTERPSNALSKKSKFRAKSEGSQSTSIAAPCSQTLPSLSTSSGGLKRPLTSIEGGLEDDLVPAIPTAREIGWGALQDDEEGSESPVSLWISPVAPPGLGKHIDPPLEDTQVDNDSADVAEVLDSLLAAVDASESVVCNDFLGSPDLENSASFQFSPAPREEYPIVWPLGGSPLDASLPRCTCHAST